MEVLGIKIIAAIEVRVLGKPPDMIIVADTQDFTQGVKDMNNEIEDYLKKGKETR